MDEKAGYRAHLQHGGTGLPEMRSLLTAFAEHGDYNRLRRQTLQENLLGKASEYMLADSLKAFRRRFLRAAGLPPASLVARAMRAPLTEAAKVQILVAYFLSTDPLVEDCYRALVLRRVGTAKATLTGDEVTRYLRDLEKDHPELSRWSPYLRARWSRGFLALLRQLGLMERVPGGSLRRLYLLPEPFAFFWLGSYEQGGSFWSAARSGLWSLLQVDERRLDELLVQGQLRGWWYYQCAGDIVSFMPRCGGVQEWLENGLV